MRWQRSKNCLRASGVRRSRLCFQKSSPTFCCREKSTASRICASLQRDQKPSTTWYSNPNCPANCEKFFTSSSVFSPPSRYFQTARPVLSQSVLIPHGKCLLSGGGET